MINEKNRHAQAQAISGVETMLLLLIRQTMQSNSQIIRCEQKKSPQQDNYWRGRLLPSSFEGTFITASSQAAYKEKAAWEEANSKMAKLSRKKNRKRLRHELQIRYTEFFSYPVCNIFYDA